MVVIRIGLYSYYRLISMVFVRAAPLSYSSASHSGSAPGVCHIWINVVNLQIVI